MHYVIGSGPAGVACAYALVAAGKRVTILDAGLDLESDRKTLRASVAQRERRDWTSHEVSSLRIDVAKDVAVPLKRVHGSDYPYRTVLGAPDIHYSSLNIRASFAKGGLSNVWGGAMLPYRNDDIRDWPISAMDLARGYEEVLKIVPMTAMEDGLAELFPLHCDHHRLFNQSQQVATLMQAMIASRQKLRADGVSFGNARLAVYGAGYPGKLPCIYCGFCLHGCPRELIYSSRQSLDALIRHKSVNYLPGVTVQKLMENGDSVQIYALMRDGSRRDFVGSRVYLGAGILNSTTILLRSLGLYETPVLLQDSQYYLFPLLQFRAARRVAEQPLHTLCQAFIEIIDERISPHSVHLQVYGYNDQLGQILDHKLGRLKRIFPRNILLGRLILVQGYLHSTHSGSILAKLSRRGTHDALFLEPVLNSATPGTIKQVLQKLTASSLRLRAVPLPSLLQITEPGRGFHTGGSFPMTSQPGPMQTDVLGRPYRMQRVHVVDATIFPTIPATTITLTVMANAYRIASEVAHLQPTDAT